MVVTVEPMLPAANPSPNAFSIAVRKVCILDKVISSLAELAMVVVSFGGILDVSR